MDLITRPHYYPQVALPLPKMPSVTDSILQVKAALGGLLQDGWEDKQVGRKLILYVLVVAGRQSTPIDSPLSSIPFLSFLSYIAGTTTTTITVICAISIIITVPVSYASLSCPPPSRS